MTFNNDVDLGSLFDQFYTLVMGKSSNGFTILEISYSVGIGLGVLIFFNHFGHLKLSDDPTPMQVQMRTYEDDMSLNPGFNDLSVQISRLSHKKLLTDFSAKSFFI